MPSLQKKKKKKSILDFPNEFVRKLVLSTKPFLSWAINLQRVWLASCQAGLETPLGNLNKRLHCLNLRSVFCQQKGRNWNTGLQYIPCGIRKTLDYNVHSESWVSLYFKKIRRVSFGNHDQNKTMTISDRMCIRNKTIKN